MLLEGRNILVTGASSGIGLAALGVFAREGARVLGVARRIDAAAVHVASLQAAGHEVALQVADVRASGEIEAAIATLEARWGPLDGAFNNASLTQDAFPVDEIPEAVFDEIMTTNVKGTWLCLCVELVAMKPRQRGARRRALRDPRERALPGHDAHADDGAPDADPPGR